MKREFLHYIVLVSILILASAAFTAVRGNAPAQRTIGLITSFAYVLWGIMHHALVGDLHRKVVIEYVLMGLLAMLLILLVIV